MPLPLLPFTLDSNTFASTTLPAPCADGELRPFCTQLINSLGQNNVNAPASVLGGGYTQLSGGTTLMDQCLAEQRYVRGSQLRTLIYSQVSVCCSRGSHPVQQQSV